MKVGDHVRCRIDLQGGTISAERRRHCWSRRTLGTVCALALLAVALAPVTSAAAQGTDADLSVAVHESADPVNVGDALTYTFTVTNAGPSRADGVTLRASLPGGIEFETAEASQGSCSADGAGVVTCGFDELLNGGTATVAVDVATTGVGTVITTAEVSGSHRELDGDDNYVAEATGITGSGSPAPSRGSLVAALTSPAAGSTIPGGASPTLVVEGAVRFERSDVRFATNYPPPDGGASTPNSPDNSVQTDASKCAASGVLELVGGSIDTTTPEYGCRSPDDLTSIDDVVAGPSPDHIFTTTDGDGVPFRVDASVPLSGTIDLQGQYATTIDDDLTAELTISGVERGSAGPVEHTLGHWTWVLGENTWFLSGLSESGYPSYQRDFAGSMPAELDGKELESVTARVSFGGREVHVQRHIQIGAPGKDDLTIPRWTERRVEVAVDSGQFSSDGVSVAADWTGWNATISTLSPGTHTIHARAVQGSRTSRPVSRTITVTSGSPAATPSPSPTDSGSPSPAPSEPPQPDTSNVAFTPNSTTAGQYSDETLFEARLADSNGDLLGGRELSFELVGTEGQRTLTAITGDDGVAAVTPTLEETPGPHQVTVRFAGDEEQAADADTMSFVVDKEDSALELSQTKGKDKALVAHLYDGDTPEDGIAGRTIDFYAGAELIGSAETDSDGVATFTPPKQKGKPQPHEARFGGDDFYLGASDNDAKGGKGGGGTGGSGAEASYAGKMLLM